MSRAERSLEVAERVAQLLAEAGVESALIGALAMAAHRYSRATHEVDLGTSAALLPTLRDVGVRLEVEGFKVELSHPEPDDPLGGVVNVTGEDFELVQIVNFLNPWRGAPLFARDAIRLAEAAGTSSSALRVVDLPHLIALKLYAGGSKSLEDVRQLLAANPDADREGIRQVSKRAGLEEALERLFAEDNG